MSKPKVGINLAKCAPASVTMGGDRDKLPTGSQVDKDKVARHRASFTRVGSLFFLPLQLRHSFCFCFFFFSLQNGVDLRKSVDLI